MKVLVTGASGFFGSHAVRAMLRGGHEVFALRRAGTQFGRLPGESARVRWFDLAQGPLSLPFEQAGRMDAVVHAATCYGRAGESAATVLRTNVLLPLELMAAATQAGCPLFVNLDTYFHKARTGADLGTAYAISKRQLVEWGRQAAKAKQLRFVNLKLEHLYGPDDQPEKFVSFIVSACRGNQPEIKLTGGEQIRDFIHVSDAVAALLAVLKPAAGTGFEEHELGTGTGVSLKHFVEHVQRVTGSASRLLFGALPYPAGEIMHSVADNASLARLGWRPAIGWQAGIESLIQTAAPAGVSP